MITNFKAEIDGTEFDLRTMNVKKLQLFQVYVMYENNKKRFHMQVNEQGTFRITDLASCPETIHPLEQKLSMAILKNGEID